MKGTVVAAIALCIGISMLLYALSLTPKEQRSNNSAMTMQSASRRKLQTDDENDATDYYTASIPCPFEDCHDIPVCYDFELNTGVTLHSAFPSVDTEGRLYNDDFIGDVETCALDLFSLYANNYGVLQQPVEGYEGLRTLAFMGTQPGCQAVHALQYSAASEFFNTYVRTRAHELRNTLLTCDLQLWTLGNTTAFEEELDACRNLGNLPATDVYGNPYNDVYLGVVKVNDHGDNDHGWSQGWCEPESALAGRCDENVPGDISGPTGFLPDGGLNVNFSHGLAGEFGAPQVSTHRAEVLQRTDGEWNNEVAIVTDPDHPEEGNVARLNAYVRNKGTIEEPRWEAGPLGALVSTRHFASGSYKVRAKVPKASGYMFAYWVYQGGANLWSDMRSPAECTEWDESQLSPGEEYHCGACRDPLPTGNSPLWENQEESPGIFIPMDTLQVIANEIDVEIPANAPQTVYDCVLNGTTGKVARKYNTMNINNQRWTNLEGLGTYANMWLAADHDLIGDGQYHTYQFDWHTENGTMHVDHFIDGMYLGSNDLFVPAMGSRFWITLRTHDQSNPSGNGYWNGIIGYCYDDETGEVRYNCGADGMELPPTEYNGLALYASTYISSVEITPFYESGDHYVPSSLDQPFMNRRVVCGDTTELQCGTDPIVPYRTANYYPLNEVGEPTAPCCGAICMSNEALVRARAELPGYLPGDYTASLVTTTDPDGDCPPLVNTVPGALTDREGSCFCRKGDPDEHGDLTWGENEYDSTCRWLPDKAPNMIAEAVNTECPSSHPFPLVGGDPWAENLGCRYDINNVCLLPDLTELQANITCMQWVNENCGAPFSDSVWVAYGDFENNKCVIELHSDGSSASANTFTGVTRAELAELAEAVGVTTYTCLVDFHEYPPVAESNDCAWFINDYCPGLPPSEFDWRISNLPDINGNHVCAIRTSLAYGTTPHVDEFPGTRGACDVDYEALPPPCGDNNDCEAWLQHHCDYPSELSTSCNHFQCQIWIQSTWLAEHHDPVPICYTEDPQSDDDDGDDSGNYDYGDSGSGGGGGFFSYDAGERFGCSWNYAKFPPCAGTSPNLAACTQWVGNHCSSSEDFHVEVSSTADRHGQYRCIITSDWERSVGGTPASCEHELCLIIPSPSPTSSPGTSSSPSPSASSSSSRTPSPSSIPVPETPSPAVPEESPSPLIEEPSPSQSPSSEPLTPSSSSSPSASASPEPEMPSPSPTPDPLPSPTPQPCLTYFEFSVYLHLAAEVDLSVVAEAVRANAILPILQAHVELSTAHLTVEAHAESENGDFNVRVDVRIGVPCTGEGPLLLLKGSLEASGHAFASTLVNYFEAAAQVCSIYPIVLCPIPIITRHHKSLRLLQLCYLILKLVLSHSLQRTAHAKMWMMPPLSRLL